MIQTYHYHGEVNNYNCRKDNHHRTRCWCGREIVRGRLSLVWGTEGDRRSWLNLPKDWILVLKSLWEVSEEVFIVSSQTVTWKVGRCVVVAGSGANAPYALVKSTLGIDTKQYIKHTNSIINSIKMPTNHRNLPGTGRPVGRQARRARRGNLQPSRAAPPPPTRDPPLPLVLIPLHRLFASYQSDWQEKCEKTSIESCLASPRGQPSSLS